MQGGRGNLPGTPPSDQEMLDLSADVDLHLSLHHNTSGYRYISPLALDSQQYNPSPQVNPHLHSLSATDAAFNNYHLIECSRSATLSGYSAPNPSIHIKQEPQDTSFPPSPLTPDTCTVQQPSASADDPEHILPSIEQDWVTLSDDCASTTRFRRLSIEEGYRPNRTRRRDWLEQQDTNEHTHLDDQPNSTFFYLRDSQETEYIPSFDSSSWCYFTDSDAMDNSDIEIKVDPATPSTNGKLTDIHNHASPYLDYGLVDICALGAAAAALDQTGPDDNMNPTIVDVAPTADRNDAAHGIAGRGTSPHGEVITRGRGTVRGRGSARGRGMPVPRGRGGIYRPAKRARPQLDDEELDVEDVDESPRRKGKKRQKAAPEPEVHPAEIHRRKISLRDRLIKGHYEPQAVGMRVHNLNKVAAQAAAAAAGPAPPRQFLVPTGPNQDVVEARTANNNQAVINTQPTIGHVSAPTGFQLGRPIAYKSTPIHQLYFPESLMLALKQNEYKWKAKKHSETAVFVVVRVVGTDIMDMRVFSTLRDATSDALHTMVNEHPEAFAIPLEKDTEGSNVKFERSERASSVIRQITARPNFQLQDKDNDNGNGNENDNDSAANASNGANVAEEADMGEYSLFVIKPEDVELPRPPRISDPQPEVNERGEILLGAAPEPTFVFWGDYKIHSYGLKMEARRGDGAAVKVSVHLKNLRKPVHP
ncbi:hypothetical protein HD806DRAFT_548086 [Xylariaceae sp. AK1471]|nr:hypothetical protein HD806DRAFT_548086 [Xylariaceae sp. AK1471]